LKNLSDGIFLKSFDYNFGGSQVRPGGLIADPNGDIYFVDTVKYRVVKMSSEGKTITSWGNLGTGNGKFLEPKDLVLDNRGYLFVLDSSLGLVQKFETPIVAQIEEALAAEQFRKMQELAYAEAEAVEAAAVEAEAAAAEAAAAAKAEYKVNNPPIDFTDTLSYSISSGSVSSIISNSDDATLVVAIDTSDDGELSINLDNDNITAFDDGSYFVLVNNEEVEFSQDGNDLTIPYEAGTEKIEIVASAVVPEFGTIAMIVLAVAIVSIIVLTTKTRATLIPKL